MAVKDQPKRNSASTGIVNVCLVNLDIYTILQLFHQIFVNVSNIANIDIVVVNRKFGDVSIEPSLFHVVKLWNNLRYYSDTIHMLLFPNPLLQIDKFLFHWQINNCYFHCNVGLSKMSFVSSHNKIFCFYCYCSIT